MLLRLVLQMMVETRAMFDDRWGEVEEYLVEALAISDPVLDAAPGRQCSGESSGH